jgi:hypothetical protein
VDALADLWLAETLRTGRWSYAAASTAHVLGLSLLVGAIAALDLRLIGAWATVPVEMVARVLEPVAACGLGLAIAAGLLLFLAAPADYLRQPLFAVKLALVVIGTAHALRVHRRAGLTGTPAQIRRIGAVSLSVWLAVLVCGRMLAFVE